MPAHRKNYDDAVRLYEHGLSIGDVAETFGTTRQAMWKILKRRNVKFRSHKRYEEKNHFHRGGIVSTANSTVSKAVRKGILIVGPCEVCGLPPLKVGDRQRIHGHHDDYNFLLKVRWLCRLHHYEWHVSNVPVMRTLPMMSRTEICRLGGKASKTKFKKKQQ